MNCPMDKATLLNLIELYSNNPKAKSGHGDFSWDYKIEILDNVFGGK